MNDQELLSNLINDLDNDSDKVIDKNTNKYEHLCIICNNSKNIIYDKKNAIIVCTNCGYVLNTILDDNPEWRNYDDDTVDTSRCSLPISYLLPQSSLGTTIGGRGKNRLKILHSWNAMPYKERSFNVILKKIEDICTRGQIEKKIEHDAKILCKQVIQGTYIDTETNIDKSIIIRGLHRNSIIAGAIFFACRRSGKSRSPKEIAEVANIDYTNVTSGCTAFSKLASIKGVNLDLGSSLPEHFIRRYCIELKVQKEFTNEAIRLAKNIRLLNIASTHTPISIATGCILLLADINKINIDKKTIKDIFNISEVTINKTFKKLQKYQSIIISNELTNIISKELNKQKNRESDFDNSINNITYRLNNIKNELHEYTH